jgi:hypothetical protein
VLWRQRCVSRSMVVVPSASAGELAPSPSTRQAHHPSNPLSAARAGELSSSALIPRKILLPPFFADAIEKSQISGTDRVETGFMHVRSSFRCTAPAVSFGL